MPAASVFWSLLGVLADAAIAVQAPINAALGRGLGMPTAAAGFSFFSGAVLLAVLSLGAGFVGETGINCARRRLGCSSPAASSEPST